jgi:Terpene cyclase DEP1
VNRKNSYLFLSILGVALPYSQFVPWVMDNGLPLGLLVHQLFANRISAFFGLDVLVSSVVLLVFMGLEGRRLRLRFRWLAIVGLCAVGVSLALPLFLYLRERALEGSPGTVEASAATKT